MSDLKDVISKGVGRQLDFMECADDTQGIARVITAFANTVGGRLLIGVKKNGKIKGVNPEEEYSIIEDVVISLCEPAVRFESRVWKNDRHLILEIEVPKSEFKHKAMGEDGSLKYYIRVEEHTLKANKIVQKIWRLKRQGQTKPSELDKQALLILKNIEEFQPVSISLLYNRTGLTLKTVDSLIAQLVHWKVIDMSISEKGSLYSIPEE